MTVVLDIDISDEAKQAELLGNLLFEMYLPRKVIDVGCNNGMYLAPFLAKGCEVMGYDNNPVNPTVPVRIQDITQPFKDFADLAICLEVLEHIPSSLSLEALDNLLKTSDKIVFSAAQPGAGGVGHINCMPKQFWKETIEARGFDYCAQETEFIVKRMTRPGVMGWLLNNLMVFRRRVSYPYYSYGIRGAGIDVTAVVTSCGRFDLLKKTLDSFNSLYGYPVRQLIISDDSEDTYQHDLLINHFKGRYDISITGKNKGQARNLDHLYGMVDTKYIFHLEDDWEFIAPGVIGLSTAIMEKDPGIGLVQLDLRPAYFKVGAVGKERDWYYDYLPWQISETHVRWNGWCGSPHLLRKSTWEKLGPFSSVQNEVEYDKLYGASGLRTVWAKRPYVRHIGYGRSKMEKKGYGWL